MGQSGDAAKGQAVAQLAGVYKLSSREGEGRQRAAEPVGIPVGYTSESRRTHARSASSAGAARARARARLCGLSQRDGTFVRRVCTVARSRPVYQPGMSRR